MITYQQENLSDVFSEWLELIPVHWEEICVFDKSTAYLNPDWEVYFAYDEQKKFFMFTCRDEGKLIGYYTSFLVPHTHYKHMIVSQNDNIFLLEDYRKGLTGYKLIREAEKRLKDLKVDVITLRIKSEGDIHGLMKRLNYSPLDTTYFKEV